MKGVKMIGSIDSCFQYKGLFDKYKDNEGGYVNIFNLIESEFKIEVNRREELDKNLSGYIFKNKSNSDYIIVVNKKHNEK